MVICLFGACTPYQNVTVTPGDRYWGATFPDGRGAITAITNTLSVTRAGFSPLTEADFDFALAAARAFCADQGLAMRGDGTDDGAGLPSFFENTWELAAECVDPPAAL